MRIQIVHHGMCMCAGGGGGGEPCDLFHLFVSGHETLELSAWLLGGGGGGVFHIHHGLVGDEISMGDYSS